MRLATWRLAITAFAAAALVLPATVPTAAESGPHSQDIPIVADLTTGAGASFMHVAVNRQGNLYFESPKGELMTRFNEGYALCRDGLEGFTAYAYSLPVDDLGGVGVPPVGLGPVTITQPNPGAFPVTIVRNTHDGTIRLSQTWSVPDAAEKDVTVTMTVRNVGASTIGNLGLMRTADGHSQYGDSFFRAATTADSVFQWWDEDANGTANGLVMSARTVGQSHEAGMSTDIDNALFCGGYSDMAPIDAEGLPQVVYHLPTLAPGAEVTVAFTYRRL
jgi:hypothetical protein